MAPRLHWTILSKGEPEKVARWMSLSSQVALHWYVGKGEAASYAEAGVAAKLIREARWAEACNSAVDSTPAGGYAVILAADVRKFLSYPAAASAWPSTKGLEVSVRTVVAQVVAAMKQSGALMGGVYPVDHPRLALSMPVQSFHTCIIGDFMIIHKDCKVRFQDVAAPKEELHFAASVVSTYALTIRLNHVAIQCDHTDKSLQRLQKDRAAAKYLQRTWGKDVFVVNHRRGDSEVILYGARLAKERHLDIFECAKTVRSNLPSKPHGDVSTFLNAVKTASRRSQALQKQNASSTLCTAARKRKRANINRKTVVTHLKRKAEPRASQQTGARSSVEMKNLSVARRELRVKAKKLLRNDVVYSR